MSENDQLQQETKPAAKGPWKTIAAVVAVTLVAIWLVPGKKSDREGAPATTGEPSLLQGGSAITADPDALSPFLAPGSGDDSPGALARRLIAEWRREGTPDLDEAFRRAEKYRSEGRITDAHLLYFYAAREGHGRAALELARQADPATHDDHESLLATADVPQANKWYSKALAAGLTEAEAPLNALRADVEEAARNGDESAQRIMLQWK